MGGGFGLTPHGQQVRVTSTAKPLSRICRELSCRQCSCPIVSYPFVAPSHLRMLYPVGRKRCDSLMMLCVGEVLCIVCTPWPRFDSTIAGKHSPPRLMLLYCNQMLFIIPKCPPTQISSHFHTHTHTSQSGTSLKAIGQQGIHRRFLWHVSVRKS